MHGRLSVVRLMKRDEGGAPGISLPALDQSMAMLGPVWRENRSGA
jgi:hypothetical protein